MDIDQDSDVDGAERLFTNISITNQSDQSDSQRSTRSASKSNATGNRKAFGNVIQYFQNRTCYVITQHDEHECPVSFEYTYTIRPMTSVGIWCDIVASIAQFNGTEVYFNPIIQIQIYSGSKDIRIVDLGVDTDHRGKGHTKRLLHAIFMDLAEYFETASVQRNQLGTKESKEFFERK